MFEAKIVYSHPEAGVKSEGYYWNYVSILPILIRGFIIHGQKGIDSIIIGEVTQ